MTSPFEKKTHMNICVILSTLTFLGETSINRPSDWPFAEEYRGTYVVTHLMNQESFRRLFRGVFTSRYNRFVGNYTGSVFSQNSTSKSLIVDTDDHLFVWYSYESLKRKSTRLSLLLICWLPANLDSRYLSSWATPGYFHRGLLKDFVSDPTFYANQPC